MTKNRIYLDWNATAPLRPEARVAMLEAMDVVGNPSSVHAEGRAAKAIVEKARGQVAALVGCDRDEVVFTSGATEAAHLVLDGDWDAIALNDTEHDAVDAAARCNGAPVMLFGGAPSNRDEAFFDFFDETACGTDQRVKADWAKAPRRLICLQNANSETGVVQRANAESTATDRFWLRDATQLVGKAFRDPISGHEIRHQRPPRGSEPYYGILSGHKFGGPKGAGALIVDAGVDIPAPIRGGGQERGARSGTENVVGIAGFGAAAEAALRDLEAGVWAPIAALRDRLEARLKETAPVLIVFGEGAPRLPNTSCFAVPGWRGETQVIQMDLAGFAISAGSACSSGKVKASRVLMAMGFDEETAGSSIRVSMGPTTTEAEVMAFAEAWETAYWRWASKRR